VSNALKAQIIVLVNAILAVVSAFGVALTDAQTGAITVAANAVLGIWVALTYKNSPMRKN
jgi:hypothetical protein